MKKNILLFFLCLAVILSGCVVDVSEQMTERKISTSGSGVMAVYFDASNYKESFTVQGMNNGLLTADGIFSLWASGSSSAAAIAQNVNLFWTVDTLHHAQLFASATGSQKELVSIDKMSATIPANAYLTVNTTSNDVNVTGMSAGMNISGNESNINFTTGGDINLTTESGNITGSTALGGNATTTSGTVDITLTSTGFESLSVTSNGSGNVTVRVPAGVGVSFQLYTHGGNISLNYDKISQSSITALQTNVNGGGRNVIVKTATGNITVVNK
jgi:hypothetical protein